MKRALKAAGLPSAASVCTLRHSHISRSIEAAVPLTIIAENCGTSVRMIEVNNAKTLARAQGAAQERELCYRIGRVKVLPFLNLRDIADCIAQGFYR
jgi:hypothetical protein